MDRTAVVGDSIQQLLRDGRRDGRSLSLALALGISAHLGVGLLVPRWAHAPIARARIVPPTEIVDIEPPAPPPPPPPVPTQEPPPPAPTEAPRAKAQEHTPPPLAQAADVVTRKESPAEPADFSDSMVVGSGTTYVGGTTSASGTGLRAEHTAGGSPGSAPAPAAAPAATGPDRSRKAQRKDEAEWKCPFPSEADTASVDSAVVGLRIDVGADGAPTNVTVVRDPGHGFGREARRCALDKRWDAALDHEGSPIASSVSVNVHFDR